MKEYWYYATGVVGLFFLTCCMKKICSCYCKQRKEKKKNKEQIQAIEQTIIQTMKNENNIVRVDPEVRSKLIKELVDEYITLSSVPITEESVWFTYNNFSTPNDIRRIKEDLTIYRV